MPQKEEKPTKTGDSDKDSPNVNEIKAYYDLMVSEDLDFLEIKENDHRLRLNRLPPSAMAPAAPSSRAAGPAGRASAPAPKPATEETAGSKASISAPLAGVFYRAASPTSAPFVKEGDVVDPGHTLCLVEAMKVMNEIKAESRCRILRIAVENARPVTAGQALFQVEPA